jgi:hypothetical protein
MTTGTVTAEARFLGVNLVVHITYVTPIFSQAVTLPPPSERLMLIPELSFSLHPTLNPTLSVSTGSLNEKFPLLIGPNCQDASGVQALVY